MSEPIWLDVEILIDLHAEQLALFGGPDGIRDQGMLESALGRPINKFSYGETDLAALAAAYAFGIARNHPFVDGNKRAAFGALIVFLGLNDIDFIVAARKRHRHDPRPRRRGGGRGGPDPLDPGQLAGEAR